MYSTAWRAANCKAAVRAAAAESAANAVGSVAADGPGMTALADEFWSVVRIGIAKFSTVKTPIAGQDMNH
jgi:hypothetical protein